MKILFLSHYFPPEVNAPATRTFEHCRHWVRLGHDVTVLCCVPHHPMGRVFPGYKNKLYQVEVRDGIRVIRLLTYVTANKGVFKRTLNYVFYMVMAIFAAPFVGKMDLVLSTSPQFFNGLAGYFVSRMKRAPWILEIRDLWPSSIVSVGAVETPHWITLLEKLESFAYRKADYVVAVTNAFKTHILERGGQADRVAVIPNGVEFGDETPIAKPAPEIASLPLDGKFVAAYFGTHGMAHGLEVILEAAKLLKQQTEIVFLLVGDGAERENLVKASKDAALDNVIMVGQQPKEMMPVLWSIADASLVVLRRLDVFLTVVPSKMFEAMAAGVPIVLAVEGESAELLKAAGAGIGVKPEDPRALADAVLDLYENRALGESLGGHGRHFVREYHSREKFARRYDEIFRTIEMSRRPRNS